jgi:trans-L-3-hydroxyproline dehydratase
MYGAVLCPRTELTEAGDAHIGVLFLTNEGYSTMCGHATLALGRLFVDYAGARQFGMGTLDNMKRILFDAENKIAHVNLHAPCGLVYVTVPIASTPGGEWMTDLTRPISYRSVPSYATAISVPFEIPAGDDLVWPELANLGSEDGRIIFDIAYGGAFYIVVPAIALGFPSLHSANLKSLSEAARKLKAAFNARASLQLRQKYLKHPNHRDLEFLYGIIVTETELEPSITQANAENGLCFFADEQVDRSPTGSGVQARVALAYAKGQRKLNESCVYHSPLSKAAGGDGAFVGEAVEEVDVGNGLSGVIVNVSGSARYTGCSNFVIEENDEIGKGFWFEESMKSEEPPE